MATGAGPAMKRRTSDKLAQFSYWPRSVGSLRRSDLLEVWGQADMLRTCRDRRDWPSARAKLSEAE